jgi:putative ABC transport system ATP-binding protein
MNRTPMTPTKSNPDNSLIRLQSLTKSFSEGRRQRLVLDDVTAHFCRGDFLVILGKSGSGKSTMLNLISGIETPTAGDVYVDDEPITRLSERQRTLFRRDKIGFVFQFFNLIPTLTVLENITLPQELAGKSRKEAARSASDLLGRVGLAPRSDTFPDRLSGGEQQRVGIARALAHDPMLVLADEPTGNLDADTGERILHLLLELTRQAGKTLIMATHSADVTPYADRVCHIYEGKLVEVERPETVGAETGGREIRH